ncbi:MAG: hypothetical protein HQL19_08780, partial [Candidatus Omnitrophica bacterium]|nr:hypothetical protein [Candidatus Omnitrophota bacterium]
LNTIPDGHYKGPSGKDITEENWQQELLSMLLSGKNELNQSAFWLAPLNRLVPIRRDLSPISVRVESGGTDIILNTEDVMAARQKVLKELEGISDHEYVYLPVILNTTSRVNPHYSYKALVIRKSALIKDEGSEYLHYTYRVADREDDDVPFLWEMAVKFDRDWKSQALLPEVVIEYQALHRSIRGEKIAWQVYPHFNQFLRRHFPLGHISGQFVITRSARLFRAQKNDYADIGELFHGGQIWMARIKEPEDVMPQDGGIDFNAANLDMKIRRDGNGVILPVEQQNLDAIKIDGLVPEILSIQSARDLPLFNVNLVASSG